MDRASHSNDKRIKDKIKSLYGALLKIFETSIPRLEQLSEISSESVSIFSCDENGKGYGVLTPCIAISRLESCYE